MSTIVQHDRQQHVIHFHPALMCRWCTRWTNTAIVEDESNDFMPVCPLHGHYSPAIPQPVPAAELMKEHDSIIRFVLWIHGDRGRVSVVSPVYDLTEIPGNAQDVEDDTIPAIEGDAWYCSYSTPLGRQIDCWAVWTHDGNFVLFEDGKRFNDVDRSLI